MRPLKIGDLEIPVPIIQGGMGIGVSLSGLASAVANNGGIGVIATVAVSLVEEETGVNYRQRNINAVRSEIRKARQMSKGILGVNIMNVLTDFSEMVETSIEEGVDVIFSGAGLPLDLPKYLKEGTKTKLVPIVSSARAASILCNKWKQNYNYLPDAFVVEGPLAGGHLGFKEKDLNRECNNLEQLVTEVKEVANEIKVKFDKDIPVIAAGGIYSGEDMYHIMDKGADAVQLGTRFVATEECDASNEFKNTFIKAKDEDIQIIQSPVGLPGRTIFNNFLKETYDGERKPVMCKYNCIKTCNPKTTLYCISDALISACKGRMHSGFAFTGANAAKVTHISTVAKVFSELKDEYKKAVQENSFIDAEPLEYVWKC